MAHGLMWGLPRETHFGGDLSVLYEATIAPPFCVSPGRNPLANYYSGEEPLPAMREE